MGNEGHMADPGGLQCLWTSSLTRSRHDNNLQWMPSTHMHPMVLFYRTIFGVVSIAYGVSDCLFNLYTFLLQIFAPTIELRKTTFQWIICKSWSVQHFLQMLWFLCSGVGERALPSGFLNWVIHLRGISIDPFHILSGPLSYQRHLWNRSALCHAFTLIQSLIARVTARRRLFWLVLKTTG